MDGIMQQTVYIVDDDELIQESLMLAFEQQDYAHEESAYTKS